MFEHRKCTLHGISESAMLGHIPRWWTVNHVHLTKTCQSSLTKKLARYHQPQQKVRGTCLIVLGVEIQLANMEYASFMEVNARIRM